MLTNEIDKCCKIWRLWKFADYHCLNWRILWDKIWILRNEYLREWWINTCNLKFNPITRNINIKPVEPSCSWLRIKRLFPDLIEGYVCEFQKFVWLLFFRSKNCTVDIWKECIFMISKLWTSLCHYYISFEKLRTCVKCIRCNLKCLLRIRTHKLFCFSRNHIRCHLLWENIYWNDNCWNITWNLNGMIWDRICNEIK